MDVEAPRGLLRIFGEVEDPRVERTKLHRLSDLLVITLCAVICGADSWTEIELFGKARHDWLRTFLALPHGIPSHDTFGRVFARLNPESLKRCFRMWMEALARVSGGRLIAVDGKTLRRSFDKAHAKASIHRVSAWCAANHLVLGQLAAEEKSNEIKAIPQLLKLLDIADAVVTIDAMGCQTAIARQIVDQEGHYVLQVKKNQETLHALVKDTLMTPFATESATPPKTSRGCAVWPSTSYAATRPARPASKENAFRPVSRRTTYYASSTKEFRCDCPGPLGVRRVS